MGSSIPIDSRTESHGTHSYGDIVASSSVRTNTAFVLDLAVIIVRRRQPRVDRIATNIGRRDEAVPSM